MTILQALAKAYARLPDAPVRGYSIEGIGFLVSLGADGTVVRVDDLRDVANRKKVPRRMSVPASFKRPGTTPRAFFLWDNSAFALGVTASPEKNAAARFDTFRKRHLEQLAGQTDEGLLALHRFLETWQPDRFAASSWPVELLDQNIVFGLDSDRLSNVRIHDRPAARLIVEAAIANGERNSDNAAICLVTGLKANSVSIHPAIKGVWGGQVAGGSIVSFNASAFESYGHSQGDNAPVSDAAAAAYTGALNRFLDRDSGHRIQIGDTSTVFWADAEDADARLLAEGVFDAFYGGTVKHDEKAEAKGVGIVLDGIRQGRRLRDLAPELSQGVRFHVLGLAPNAARISIRFWLENDFDVFAGNHARFLEETSIEPPPRGPPPVLWQYLNETAVLAKRENVPPNLAGEWMRAILAGTPYPMTLLATVLMRIRADGDVNGRRVAILKALLRRNFSKSREEAPVALDATNSNRGYLLGRLFAAYEQAQSAALGRSVNATIKDKFYGAASAQPRKVFPILESGSANHLSKVGKARPGQRVNLERTIAGIMALMDPREDPFPASLPAVDQALFGLGYYHQRSFFFAKSAANTASEDATPDE